MPVPYLTQLATVAWAAGSLASPSTLATHLRTQNIDFNVENKDFIPGELGAGYIGPLAARGGGRFAQVKFSSELRAQMGNANSDADNCLPEGALLRALGFNEAIQAGGGTIYKLTNNPHIYSSGDTDPIDLTVNVDGVNQKALNCVGDATFNLKVGMIPTVDYDFRGNLDTGSATATTSSLTEGSAASAETPVPTGLAWVGAGITLNSVGSLVIEEITFKVGNQLQAAKNANATYGYGQWEIVKRVSEIAIATRVPLKATIDFEALCAAQTAIPLAWGYTAGGSTFNSYAFAVTAKVTGKYPAKTARNGFLYYGLTLQPDLSASSSAGHLTMTIS
jgi:hypothetical protein